MAVVSVVIFSMYAMGTVAKVAKVAKVERDRRAAVVVSSFKNVLPSVHYHHQNPVVILHRTALPTIVVILPNINQHHLSCRSTNRPNSVILLRTVRDTIVVINLHNNIIHLPTHHRCIIHLSTHHQCIIHLPMYHRCIIHLPTYHLRCRPTNHPSSVILLHTAMDTIAAHVMIPLTAMDTTVVINHNHNHNFVVTKIVSTVVDPVVDTMEEKEGKVARVDTTVEVSEDFTMDDVSYNSAITVAREAKVEKVAKVVVVVEASATVPV